MKTFYQVALASVVLLLIGSLSAYASGTKSSGIGHAHSETVHDRTPTVHTHGSHHHRG